MLYRITVWARRRITLFRAGYCLVVIDRCRSLTLRGSTFRLCSALKHAAIIGINCKTSEGGIVDQGRQLNDEISVGYSDVFNQLVISTVVTCHAEQIKIGKDSLPFDTKIENARACGIVIQLSKMQLNAVGRLAHRNLIAIAAITFGLIKRVFARTANGVSDNLS